MDHQNVLISSAELAERIGGGRPPILLDVRWALGDRRGREKYREGHIPGAVFVDLDAELADPPSVELGRHPLPDIERLQVEARGWGISDDSTVVAYDATGSMAAARAWWLLKWAGVADIRLLDGGLPAWIAGAHPVAAGPGAEHHRGTVSLSAGHMPTVDIGEASAFPSHGVLLDARTPERYLGQEEPVDPRAGHIPGAVNAPTGGNLREDGTFRPADQLAARFAELGVTGDVAVYCGSGVTAAHEIAALAIAGIEASLFPGSWSQWSGDARREVATG
ncbi:sulfurtransferase [Rhodococcus artemisiae]|uniref:Sulfurtransferase n=1 Tax=Rhodococcus artemisiae TaxID=714159 RepID=A0ABU7LK33_9NOCA|nr:sulfurtransferase [Rhodococcus artemisiae]MEE2061909.1 sulfurtransferase [Rhodococcus artemisiae]